MTPLAQRVGSLLHPLDEFYGAGDGVPRIQAIEGPTMPQPYRRLLVHDRDMTSTLEEFCGRSLHLTLLQTRLVGETLYRHVVLVDDVDDGPMEYGAIRIELAGFPRAAREQILQAHRPLGRILHEHSLEHACRPTGYFRIQPGPVTREVFGPRRLGTLFGRHAVLRGAGDRELAEVVEILPPLDDEPDDAATDR